PEFTTEEILPLRVNFTDAEAALNADFVTTERIYEQILDDLLKAKLLLPEKYIDGLHHPSYAYGRVDKFTAHAMLSRIYFQLGEWEMAEAELDTVIEMNGGRFTLDQDPIEAFNRSDNTRGNEVIWQYVAYDESHGQTVVAKDPTLFTFLDYRATNGGLGDYYRRSTWHIFSMSNTIAQQVGWMGDDLSVTPEAMRDKRYKQLFYRLEGNRGVTDDDPQVYEQQYTQVKEPRIWGNKYYRGVEGMNTNVPVIRLAEMYLTRSIIRFRNGDLAGAANDLNRIRERAWDATAAGNEYASSEQYITSGTITEEMIHNERIKELGFEGDRMIYLMALQLPIPPGEREGVSEVPFPYDGMLWTIPQSELDFKIEK
ncbi:MAG: RagB/SusD family nutrient uptake outer membrane protein, partial [Bacteroidales bacterium]